LRERAREDVAAQVLLQIDALRASGRISEVPTLLNRLRP